MSCPHRELFWCDDCIKAEIRKNGPNKNGLFERIRKLESELAEVKTEREHAVDHYNILELKNTNLVVELSNIKKELDAVYLIADNHAMGRIKLGEENIKIRAKLALFEKLKDYVEYLPFRDIDPAMAKVQLALAAIDAMKDGT